MASAGGYVLNLKIARVQGSIICIIAYFGSIHQMEYAVDINVNNKGPSTEPCGAPKLFSFHVL